MLAGRFAGVLWICSIALMAAGCGRDDPPPKALPVPTGGFSIALTEPSRSPEKVASGSKVHVRGRAAASDPRVSLQAVSVKLFRGELQVASRAVSPETRDQSSYSFDAELEAPAEPSRYVLYAEGLLGWADGRPDVDPRESKTRSEAVTIEVE